MDRRVVDGIIFIEYKESVKYFYDYAFGNATLLVQRWAHCPCKRCVNRKMLDRDTIIAQLYRNGLNTKLQVLVPIWGDVRDNCKG